MKKIIIALLLTGFFAVILTSCAGQRGCPALSDKSSGRPKAIWR